MNSVNPYLIFFWSVSYWFLAVSSVWYNALTSLSVCLLLKQQQYYLAIGESTNHIYIYLYIYICIYGCIVTHTQTFFLCTTTHKTIPYFTRITQSKIYIQIDDWLLIIIYCMWPLSLTWIDINTSMDKSLHPHIVWDKIIFPFLNFNGTAVEV